MQSITTMTTVGRVLKSLASCLVYSLVVILVDSVLVFLIWRELAQIVSSLSLVTLVEGAFGLIMGGMLASYSPSINKIGEALFHSAPWTAKRQREAERQARVWIATGGFLIIAGLSISALYPVGLLP